MPTTIGAGVSWLGTAIGGTGAAAGAGTAAAAGAGTAAGAGLGTALATAAVTSAVGALASKALAPKQQQQQQVKNLTNIDKPQEAKTVDYNALKDKNALAAAASGLLSGNSATLLTGSKGVSPGSLNLGTNSLLGS
jgi:hypothetical protein